MSFKHFLLEYTKKMPGEEAGQFEIATTSPVQAVQLLNHIYHADHTKSPKMALPNFARNFKFAQNMARLGSTQRKDMPVIRRVDAFQLQQRLTRGALDVKAPFAKGTSPENPFPEGLSGAQAQRFLTNGFRDGKISDDVIRVAATRKAAGRLKPIQRQIYLDKAISFGLRYTPEEFKHLVENSFMISSSDDFIIDGHHRWLFAVLADPNIQMSTLVIDLPLKTVLKLLTAYGDAIGNERNK